MQQKLAAPILVQQQETRLGPDQTKKRRRVVDEVVDIGAFDPVYARRTHPGPTHRARHIQKMRCRRATGDGLHGPADGIGTGA